MSIVGAVKFSYLDDFFRRQCAQPAVVFRFTRRTAAPRPNIELPIIYAEPNGSFLLEIIWKMLTVFQFPRIGLIAERSALRTGDANQQKHQKQQRGGQYACAFHFFCSLLALDFLTQFEIRINRLPKIRLQCFACLSFIQNQTATPLHLAKEHAVRVGKFDRTDTAFVRHRLLQFVHCLITPPKTPPRRAFPALPSPRPPNAVSPPSTIRLLPSTSLPAFRLSREPSASLPTD